LAQVGVDAATADAVRKEARRLLRHFPGRSDMSLAHDALPCWFGDVPRINSGRGQEVVADQTSNERASWRVGIVQSVDGKTGRCKLQDGLTEEPLQFVAKDEAARQRLQSLSPGNLVDYKVDERGRIVSVGAPHATDLPAPPGTSDELANTRHGLSREDGAADE
jgi:hypothetical protein